ncbi:MAG: ABC transporter substrate-binding protein [Myxococcaceae bacterium]
MRFFWGVIFVGIMGWCSHISALNTAHVAIGQIVEHPALDTLRTSLKEGLEKAGFVEGHGLKWTYENAQGNPTTAVQISHKLISLQPSVIVTLSTPMSQAVASATTTIPLVFGAVTDPEAAKLTNHANITGLTDFVPPEKQIALIQKIIPKIKTLGVIFNAGEVNSQKQVEGIKAACDRVGIKVIEATASKTSDVPSAIKTLVGRCEAVLLPTDNTVVSALESILKITNSTKTHVFGSDVDIVRRGAVAAYGVDWHESGLALARIVESLLKGQSIETLPIQNPQKLDLHLNRTAAQKMDISIPEEVQKTADKVF